MVTETGDRKHLEDERKKSKKQIKKKQQEAKRDQDGIRTRTRESISSSFVRSIRQAFKSWRAKDLKKRSVSGGDGGKCDDRRREGRNGIKKRKSVCGGGREGEKI